MHKFFYLYVYDTPQTINKDEAGIDIKGASLL